jgi:hypothetical protein
MKYNSENKRIFWENHLGDFWGKKFDAEGNRIENHKS